MYPYKFNKLAPAGLVFPVTTSNYPASSRMHSPLVGNPHGLPAPSMPGDEAFEHELMEVMAVRVMYERNKWPADFLKKHHPRASYDPNQLPMPLVEGGITRSPHSLANAVHMDHPIDLAKFVLRWLLKQGVQPRTPESNHNNFLQRVPDAMLAATVAVCDNMRKCFEVKYYYGRPRPEEAMLEAGYTRDLVTNYPEGCPPHPAYPAGHAAAAAAVNVFRDYFVLTQAQWDVVFDSAYVFAQGRTVAGVHYASDNLAGLTLGGLTHTL